MPAHGFLDTSVVIRYLVNDDQRLAEQAQRIIVSDTEFSLTDATLAEIAHVLNPRLSASPARRSLTSLILLIRRPNMRLHGLDLVLAIQALQLCRPSGRVSFADALLWASARSAGATIIYTFDDRFPADGLAIRREA